MYPIFIVAKREFLHRIRQRIFWVFLILGPLFFLLILVIPIGLSMNQKTEAQIAVLDQSGVLLPYLYSEKDLALVPMQGQIDQVKAKASEAHYDGLLCIDKTKVQWVCRYYRIGMLGGGNSDVVRLLLQQRIQQYEIDQSGMEAPTVLFTAESVSSEGTDLGMGFVAGLFLAILTLVFVNQYAQMVLRGVVEEKQNRISELILTSIKPTHFILGKVIGIASVAFLQMGIWFCTTSLLSWTIYRHFQLGRFTNAHLATTLSQTNDLGQTMEINSILNALQSLPLGALLVGFLFYFIFGYLLFSALFAMIGIAVGSDSDAHQMAMPITMPLAIPLLALQFIVDNPYSTFSRFLSIFPLTSPTAMMIRLPFGVEFWEILLSGTFLVISFLLVSYCAAKVYRIGVLMYGKKLTWGEMWKWALNS